MATTKLFFVVGGCICIVLAIGILAAILLFVIGEVADETRNKLKGNRKEKKNGK